MFKTDLENKIRKNHFCTCQNTCKHTLAGFMTILYLNSESKVNFLNLKPNDVRREMRSRSKAETSK